jgi:hypothetical protein
MGGSSGNRTMLFLLLLLLLLGRLVDFTMVFRELVRQCTAIMLL